ncbi:MAG: hypothetical protein L6263_12670 [Desulfobacteraceae bacterium]|nr:hypothetical protein [Desulfobacteraceae bacterium]MCG2826528.1 hypothetical protein [Thermoplasmatales archaeon]
MKNIKLLAMILLSVIALVSAASAAEISVGSVNMSTSGIKSINITVSNVTDLNTASFKLTFNSSVIKINNIQAGNFWNPGILNNIQNTSGYATSYMDLNAGVGVTGSGTIVVVTIEAIGNRGSFSSLNIQPLAGVLLLDVNTNPITATIQNGIINIPFKGDVDGYAGITMADAMYIGKAVLNKPGFTLDNTTMDVDGQLGVTLNDALYLAKFVIGVPGFETLQ